MPRDRRIVRNYALIHVIVRFLNRAEFLDSDQARAGYLQRAGRYFARSDWRLLSYALMSTHVHFGAISGEMPIAKITQPLHCSFVHWLKARRELLGPIVAMRPTTKELPIEAAPILIAYHHNNPVKAGLAATARDSSWTSHRDYLRGNAPEWLHTDLGLALSGLENTEADRARFETLVSGCAGVDLDDDVERRRAHTSNVRSALGSSVELGSPRISRAGDVISDLLVPQDAVLHPAWQGSLQLILEAAAWSTGIPTEAIRSKSRNRTIVRARRLFVLCAHGNLHRPIGQVAAAMGITSTAARKLERTASIEDRRAAQHVASRFQRQPTVAPGRDPQSVHAAAGQGLGSHLAAAEPKVQK